ncbi:MAG: hypothetical protein LQ346_002877 [Caloplaca aetnensis]|nr:MAG: hypothetical protein LQ346_002877 [Caloplaca aetnensis]
MATMTSDGNPFVDPVHPIQPQRSIEQSTLIVGRTASLTLATDSLIVLDEGFAQKRQWNCFGLLRNDSTDTQAIPLYNILWAELSAFEITIRYAKPGSRNTLHVATINYPIEKPAHPHAISWVENLLDRAYGESQRKKRIKVLINPFGGKGKAQKWYLRDIEPIFAAARCDVDVEKTQYRGHAVEIAEHLDPDAYDVVAACSGDGLPYEVFNGLGKKSDARQALEKIAVVQLPCGTGNALSLNLNGTDSPSMAALCIVKGIRTPLDLTSITQGDRRTLSFLSQSIGIVAESDLATEHLRWLGSTRFTYGILVRLLRKTVYPCDLAIKVEVATKAEVRDYYQRALKDRPVPEQHRGSLNPPSTAGRHLEVGLPSLQFGTISDELPSGWTLFPYEKLGNFYSGNMALMAPDTNFFPATLPNDGCMDLVMVDGDISRTAAIRSIMAVGSGTFFDMPHVQYQKISGYRIIPRNQKDGYISIDGERMPFEPFQAEVHRGLGTTLSKSGHFYEAPGLVARGRDSA